jgi:hypothetical protein
MTDAKNFENLYMEMPGPFRGSGKLLALRIDSSCKWTPYPGGALAEFSDGSVADLVYPEHTDGRIPHSGSNFARARNE